MKDVDSKAWFAPKRFGYGAGLPIAWQGWVLIAAQLAAMLAGIVMSSMRGIALSAWIITFAILPLPLIAAKTKGGWQWRWGLSNRPRRLPTYPW